MIKSQRRSTSKVSPAPSRRIVCPACKVECATEDSMTAHLKESAECLTKVNQMIEEQYCPRKVNHE